MRYFLIFICLIPFCLNGQIIIDDTTRVSIDSIKNKGCDCKIKTDIIKKKVINTIDTIQNEELIACCYHCLAIYYHSRVENYLESISHHKKALKIRNEYQKEYIWKSHYGLALAYDKLNMPYQSGEYFREVISRLNDVKRERDSINIFRSFADNLTKIGEIEEAVYFGKEAVKVSANNKRLATAYNTLSKVFTENTEDTIMYKQAVAYSDTAIVLFDKPKKYNDFLTIARIYNNKARAFGLLDRHTKAIEIYIQSLQIRPKDDILGRAQVINNIGVQLNKQKKYKEAIDKFKQSLQLKKSYHNNALYHRDYAINYENIAGVYKMLNQINRSKKVVGYYQLALINLTDNFKDEDIKSNPKVTGKYHIYNKPDLLRLLDLKAQAALKAKKIDLAHDTYQELDNWINEFYKDLSTNQSKLTWIARAHAMYTHAIEVALKKDDKEKAFQYAEKARAVLLWQSHSQQAALSLLDDKEREKYDNLLAQIRQADYEYRDAETDEEKDELKGKLDRSKQAFDQFEKTLSDSIPEYTQRKYQPKKITVKDVQKNMLNDTTVLIEYHWSADDMLYIFTLAKNDIYIDNIQLDSTFHSQIQQFYTEIGKDGDFSKFVTPGYSIYQTIFDTIRIHLNENIKKIILLPDGQLNYIPFEALPTNNDAANVQYLLDDYLFNYRYSCGNYSDSKVSDIIHTTLYIAPEFDGKNNLAQLKNPKISKYLNYGKLIKLSENKPTQERVTQEISDADLVHFHTHAEQGGKGKGKIHLSNGDELTQNEIQALKLKPPRHVVLSACKTGTGDLSKGEGVLSLGWSFVYRGVPSVVMSLWNVNDTSTGELMKSYYKLLKKHPADEALQKAKIKMRKDGKHPYHWSAFIHTGNPPTIHFAQNSHKYLYMSGVFLLMFSLLIYGIKRAINP